MINLTNLESDKRFGNCFYHLKEIVNSQQEISTLLVRLDEVVDRDPSRAARYLSFLRVEIYAHLLKHIHAARLPLMEVIRETYASLGEEAPPGPEDDPLITSSSS